MTLCIPLKGTRREVFHHDASRSSAKHMTDEEKGEYFFITVLMLHSLDLKYKFCFVKFTCNVIKRNSNEHDMESYEESHY